MDWGSGTLIAYGVLAAILWREKTGLGTMIEFSQVQTSTRFTEYAVPLYGRFGIVRQRWGNWDTQLCVHGVILCGKSDYPDAQNPQERLDARYVMVSAFNDPDFKELCDITRQKQLYEKYKAHKDRVEAEAQVEIYGALEKWAADKTRSQVVKTLTDAGILAAPVMNDREVYESEHYRQRGTLRWMDDPLYGDVLIHSGYSAGLLSKTPRRVNWIWRPVGGDNVKIYNEWLGYPLSKIEQWYAKSWI